MFLAIAAGLATVYICPSARATVNKALLMSTLTAIGLYRSLKNMLHPGAKLLAAKEIVHNYRTGAITKQTLAEFALFKARLWATRTLESGLLTADKRSYELIYYDGDRRFRVRFPKNRSIRQIVKVSTGADFNTDITSEFWEVLGPGHNFHGILSTPALLGWPGGLKVRYRNGVECIYSSDDVINLLPGKDL